MGFRKPISSVILSGGGGKSSQIGAVAGAHGFGPASALKTEVDNKNRHLKAEVHALETLLEVGLCRDAHVAVGEWRAGPTLDDVAPDTRAPEAPRHDRFVPAPLSPIARLVPGAGARHAEAVAAGEAALKAAAIEWDEQRRRQADALARLADEVEAHNHHLEALEGALKAGQPQAVQDYARRVLTKSPYPQSLPREIKIGFREASNQLNVVLRLPDMAEVVPPVERYRLAKPRGEIAAVKRSLEDGADLAERVVAQIALRTLHEVFSTDDGHAIGSVKLKITASAVEPSTGRSNVMPLVVLRVTRAAFDDMDLTRVEPIACLERLKALDGSRGGGSI
jgi:restriction system protein